MGRQGRGALMAFAHLRCSVTDEVRRLVGQKCGRAAIVKKLIEALRVILGVQPPVASESRWGTIQRAAAALSLRVLLHRVGPRALAANFSTLGLAQKVRLESVDTEVPLAELQGRRMRVLKDRWADGTTLPRYLILTVALDS